MAASKFTPTAIALLAAAAGVATLTAPAAHAQIVLRPPVFFAPALAVPQVVVPQVVVPPSGVVVEPQAVAAAPAVEFVPTAVDAFVVNAAPADVVVMNGDTYIWAVDEHGNRYRRFYGHGDRRADLFHRREELHRVMERNGGHLPGREGFHGEARREAAFAHEVHREEHAEVHAAMEHNAAVARAEAHGGAPAPGFHPGAPVPQVHAPGPAAPSPHAAPAPQAHPAAAAPAHKK